MGLIDWSGRFLEEGNGNPHQHSCMGSPTDRGAWQAATMGLQSWTQLRDWTTTTTYIMLGCFPTLRAFLQNNVHHCISKHIAFLPLVSFLFQKKIQKRLRLNMSNLHGQGTQDGRKRNLTSKRKFHIPSLFLCQSHCYEFSTYIFSPYFCTFTAYVEP